ncbi:oxidoreductase [Microbacterium bovistercoris]|uniref:Oxidoreductase n=1 Tax=Microbacterium bovistercoris TaxID=2293570 RepID=A0A371NZR7_9MICO|nr:DUF6807 family protein [Microbacterium bovistercoris]REJ08367.1 oxidoreductase [Microbacterium bovistercoris]
MTIDLLPSGAVRYHEGAAVRRGLSPRPYLTATAPGGAPATEVSPDDHLHHLGLSLALPDVSGASFWGGSTYRRGEGSVMLDNHGIQQVTGRDSAPGRVDERLVWRARDGSALLHEERTISAQADAGQVMVSWTTRLTPAAGGVTFGSPQTNGRPGAFYGGLFWRTALRTARVRTADGDGVDAAHGSTSPWIALDGEDASFVAATSTGMPWFVRSEGYVGFLPAVAVEERRVLAPGETLLLDLVVAIADDPFADPADVAGRLLSGIRDAV